MQLGLLVSIENVAKLVCVTAICLGVASIVCTLLFAIAEIKLFTRVFLWISISMAVVMCFSAAIGMSANTAKIIFGG